MLRLANPSVPQLNHPPTMLQIGMRQLGHAVKGAFSMETRQELLGNSGGVELGAVSPALSLGWKKSKESTRYNDLSL